MFQLRVRTGHPDLLDLPWREPLDDWSHDRLVEVPLGIHRHPVRVVDYDEGRYVVKELPRRYAEREWVNLRRLVDEAVPAVTVVGLVTGRSTREGEPLDAAVVTRWLDHAMTYRALFARVQPRELRDPILDALVDLLVRAHLNGFLWGDCSLSNTLFVRDAGCFAAHIVDTETGELHDWLTDGQRAWELETTIEKCAGELFDLQAGGLLEPDVDPAELGDELRARYEALWSELIREDVFGADERHRIHERLRRINELGYDVEEVELVEDDEGAVLHLRTSVPEPGRHRRLLRELTGLEAMEHQARRLLSDIQSFGAYLAEREGRTFSDQVKARRWMGESFDPVIDVMPADVLARREPPQIFHEVLDHWYRLSEAEGSDVELVDAARSYAAQLARSDTGVLPAVAPDGLGER